MYYLLYVFFPFACQQTKQPPSCFQKPLGSCTSTQWSLQKISEPMYLFYSKYLWGSTWLSGLLTFGQTKYLMLTVLFFFFFQLAGILCFPGMRRMSERSVCLSFFPVDEHAVKEWKNADILLIWKVSFSSFHPFRKVNNCKDYSIAVTREGKKEKRGEKSLLKSFLRYIEVLFPADCIFFLY